MSHRIIDAHIHLDWYDKSKREQILNELSRYHIEGLITVSSDFPSSSHNLQLAKNHPRVHTAAGFHPEQQLHTGNKIDELFSFIDKYKEDLTAIGEVGLPYYLRQEDPSLSLKPYIELLEKFIKKSAYYNKPIVLHAIYEDAGIACDLLEQHNVKKAHFHWFKGNSAAVHRLKQNGYHVSVTPDCLYKERTHQLIQDYPLELLMVETDGPWDFKQAEWTHPRMIHDSVKTISEIKKVSVETVYKQLLSNTINFYQLSHPE
ncbi:TatD family hydrolase [Halobacillus sp. B23F22_1]|uniref:TatD family hydrolase n=1 Tax=Halobacillus sp. B23F22_1 TaxID=3459514 RepID=UPI00373ED7C8